MIQVAEGTPVIGHVTAGVYAATGDLEKAEDVALGATKSTVIAAAGIAGAACGPGAVACGASLAVSANALWDTSDSLISGTYQWYYYLHYYFPMSVCHSMSRYLLYSTE